MLRTNLLLLALANNVQGIVSVCLFIPLLHWMVVTLRRRKSAKILLPFYLH
jgi:hypothetical protein